MKFGDAVSMTTLLIINDIILLLRGCYSFLNAYPGIVSRSGDPSTRSSYRSE